MHRFLCFHIFERFNFPFTEKAITATICGTKIVQMINFTSSFGVQPKFKKKKYTVLFLSQGGLVSAKLNGLGAGTGLSCFCIIIFWFGLKNE